LGKEVVGKTELVRLRETGTVTMKKAKKLVAILGVTGGLLWFVSIVRHFLDIPPDIPPIEVLALGVLLSLAGIVGGILALTKPARGGTLMLASGLGGFFAPFFVFWFWLDSIWRGELWFWALFPTTPIFIVGVVGALLMATWEQRSGARIAALALGIIAGFVSAHVAHTGMRSIQEEFLFLGVLSSFMGIAGAALALARPRAAGRLMLASWAGCFIAAFLVFIFVPGLWSAIIFYLAHLFAGVLFMIGGLLALDSRTERPASIKAAMVLGIMGGLIAAWCALGARPPFMLQEREAWETLRYIWVFPFPVMGFTAGILALARPKVAGILMLISGISGYVGFFALGLHPHYEEFAICALGGLLLVIGGILLLAGRKKQPSEGMPA
jgi:hypothetical protein